MFVINKLLNHFFLMAAPNMEMILMDIFMLLEVMPHTVHLPAPTLMGILMTMWLTHLARLSMRRLQNMILKIDMLLLLSIMKYMLPL